MRQRWQHEGHYRGLTVSDAVDEAVSRHPETRFHFYSESGCATHTVAALNVQAHAIARGLGRLGIGRGDVLAVQMPMLREAVVLYLAAAHVGAIALPILNSYGPAELTAILEAGKARALALPSAWRTTDYAARLAAVSLPASLEHLIVVGDTARFGARAIAYDILQAPQEREAEREAEPDAAGPQDEHLLIFSSGTTGGPKGIRHSNETILAEYTIPFLANEGPVLDVMPPGHIASLVFIFHTLLHGVERISLDRWDAALAAELAERHGVTQSAGVPPMMMGLLEAAARDGRDLSSLRSYKLGGTGITPHHVQTAERAGIVAGRFYGLSEHPTVTIVGDRQTAVQRATTDGVLCAGTEVRIVDDDGGDVALGADGEIVTRGPELFVGYTDPQLDLESFMSGGWFRTGDIGHLDAAGCLTITDRKKDLIIRGGENISPKEIEGLLLEHPAIVDVSVVGYPDERLGERVCAVIVAREGRPVALEQLTAHLLARGIAKFKLPERLMPVDALPLNPNGKVRKDVLRERVRQSLSAG